MPVPVRLNQKRRNSGENRAENSGTDDALPHVNRAAWVSTTITAARVCRTDTRTGPRRRLILLGEVDRSRCQRRGKACV